MEEKDKIHKLDISRNVPHTYLWYAMKFSILNYPQYLEWYHSHFLNPIVYAYKGINLYKIDYCEYFDEINIFSDVLEIKIFTNENNVKTNINEFFRNSIAKEWYITIDLDFYYIKEYNREYSKKHYTHPLLVYGYSDNMYLVLGFNHNGIFSTFSVTIDEFIQAYKSAIEINYASENVIDKCAYHLLKRKNITRKFDQSQFMNQLKMYYEGSYQIDASVKFLKGMNDRAKIVTGIMAVNALIESVINDSLLTTDYRIFHFMSEQKAKLLDAIKFWKNGLKINDYLINDYTSIVKKYDGMRLRVLKDIYKYGKKNIFANMDYIYDRLMYIEKLEKDEKNLIENILSGFK